MNLNISLPKNEKQRKKQKTKNTKDIMMIKMMI